MSKSEAADDAERKELRTLLDQTGLTQKDLSELIGVSIMTVNRWLSDRDYDTRPPPFYAIQFMRVFAMLPEKMQIALPRWSPAAKKKAP